MKILVLGGSHFVGRALVEVAVGDGLDVTTLNRGRSGTDTDGATLIRVDRTNHDAFAAAVHGRSWDAVIDTWAGAPLHSTVAAQLLGPMAGHYGYVSSRSVYSWPITPGLDESHPPVEGDPQDTTSDDYAKPSVGVSSGYSRRGRTRSSLERV